MICGFIGHRDAPNDVKQPLEAVIKALIEKGVKSFYVGNNGNFDLYAQQVLEERKKENKNVNYNILISLPWERALSGLQERTLYPEGLEKVPFRFAITKRNEYLLKKTDVLIVYQKYSFSNSYKLVEKAKRSGKVVINLAKPNDLEKIDLPLDNLK